MGDRDLNSESREFELHEEEFRVEACGVSNDTQTEVCTQADLTDDSDEAFRFRMEFENSNAEAETEITLKVFNPIQYQESGATPGFQPLEDVIVDSAAGVWSGFVKADGLPVSWTAENTNKLSMKFYLPSAPTTLITNMTTLQLDANQIKFDTWAENLVWSANATHFAFRVRVETEMDDDIEDGELDDDNLDAPQMNIPAAAPGVASSFFQFDRFVFTYAGDLASPPTKTPLLVTRDGQDVYLTVDTTSKPQSVLWDPILGVAPAINVNAASATSVGTCATLALALSVMACL